MISRSLNCSFVWCVFRHFCFAFVAFGLSGCSAIVDLDRFQQSPDLTVIFEDLDAEDKRVEFRIVTNEASPQFLARGVIDLYDTSELETDAPLISITFPGIAAPGVLPVLELYIDDDGDNDYDPAEDRAFQLIAQGETIIFVESEATEIVYDDTPVVPPENSVDLTLRGFEGPHSNDLFELKVVRTSDGAVVGYYRTEGVAPDTQVFIPRVFDNASLYHLEFYGDKNSSKDYDPPNADHAWIVDDAALPEFVHDAVWLPLPAFE